MGKGISGPSGLPATIQQGIEEGFEKGIEDRMMSAMKVPVQAGDNAGAQARFQNARKIMQNMNPQRAGEVLDQLNSKNPSDPLAKEIQYRFSDVSVDRLKHDLASISGRSPETQSKDAKPGKPSRGPSDTQTKKSDIGLNGNVKQTDLLNVLKASIDAQMEKRMEERADHIFYFADINHKMPEGVLSNLRGLTKEEGEVLAKVWQKKYGTSLDVHLKAQLSGRNLEDALDMVNGHTHEVDMRDASRRANQLMQEADRTSPDPAAIKKLVWGLHEGQPQMLRKMFEQRYGQSLDDMLREKLSGEDLDLAQKYLRGENPGIFPIAIP